MPWGRIDDSFYDHRKLKQLTPKLGRPLSRLSDRQQRELLRLAAQGLHWKVVSWCNRHLTDGVIPDDEAEELARDGELAEALIPALTDAGLWEVGDDSHHLVHDFLRYNDSREMVLKRQEIERKRKADWRAKRLRGNGHDEPEEEPDEPPTGGRGRRKPPSSGPGGTGGKTVDKPPRPAGTNGVTRGVSRAKNSGTSAKSRQVSRRVSRDSRPGPSRPVPARPIDSLYEENRGRTRGERADVQALLDAGYRRVTANQRRLLDELLDRHDVTGPEWAAERVRGAPDGVDPLTHVLAEDRAWQAERRAAADNDEAAAAQSKATDAEQARAAWRRISETKPAEVAAS